MILKKAFRIKHPNSSKCTVYEYPHNEKTIDIAVAEINGRYPDEGIVVNEEVKEMVYVVSGNGKISLDGRLFELNVGDTVLINQNQRYFFEGKLEIIITCSPAWYPSQYKNLK